MKLGIMQPYLLPYIGYFQLINMVDKFIIFDDVNYIKKGWINRNNILINNKKFLFTLPLEKPSQNKFIKDTKIFNSNSTKQKLIEDIFHAYRKAPQFESVYPIIKSSLLIDEDNLSEYNIHSIKTVCNYLGIETEIVKSSYLNNNKELKSENKIIDICKLLNADMYINPIGGMGLYSRVKFEQNSIKLHFIKTNEIKYRQFNENNIENLSIIDVLMFNRKEKVKKMLDDYILI
ncbi:WbqC family protein [Clostridium neonatale]|uniref:WbqC family protein n=1 Tax=Clostridium neonatale TaxID=137838 RepID=UPI003D33FF28